LQATNVDVDFYNYEYIERMDETITILKATDSGKVKFLRKCSAMKAGCCVILIKTINKELPNGLIGTVVAIKDNVRIVDFCGKMYQMKNEFFLSFDEHSVLLAKRIQCPP
jgi:hypothetical protein